MGISILSDSTLTSHEMEEFFLSVSFASVCVYMYVCMSVRVCVYACVQVQIGNKDARAHLK